MSKRALTFTPPSQRKAKISEMQARKAKTRPTDLANVKGITESIDAGIRVPAAPRAPAHPDNVGSPKRAPVVAQDGVVVTIADHEAVVVLGSLLEARDKALKGAEAASAQGKETEADQLLGKAVALEGLCERVGRAFVERRMQLAKK